MVDSHGLDKPVTIRAVTAEDVQHLADRRCGLGVSRLSTIDRRIGPDIIAASRALLALLRAYERNTGRALDTLLICGGCVIPVHSNRTQSSPSSSSAAVSSSMTGSLSLASAGRDRIVDRPRRLARRRSARGQSGVAMGAVINMRAVLNIAVLPVTTYASRGLVDRQWPPTAAWLTLAVATRRVAVRF